MANDGSLAGVNPQCAFDLETQKGIMMLLAAVRASGLTAPQKNELRDLAFLYINGGKDQSVRITLQQKVLGYDLQPLTPVEPETPVVPSPIHPFGTSRPSPSFSITSTPISVPTTQPITSPQTVVSSLPVTPPIVSEQSVPVPEVAPAPVVPVPQPITEPVVVPEPVPVQVPDPISVPVAAPTPTPIPAPEVSPIGYDPDTAMQRIREIKTLVNEKVGNPVNLVDIDNAVGREYMAALLDAMKKLNSGTSASSAMKRLEESFIAVEKTIEAHRSGTSAVAAEPPQPVVSAAPVEPTPVVVEPVTVELPSIPVVPEISPIPDMTPEPVLSETPVIPEIPIAPPPVFEPVFQPIPEPAVANNIPPVVPEPVLSEPVEPVPPEIVELPEVFEPVSVSVPAPKPKIVPPPAPQPIPLPRTYGTVPVQDPDYVVSVRENIIVDESQHVTSVTPPEAVPVPIPSVPRQPQATGGKIESAWGPSTDHLPEDRGRVVSVAESKQKLRTPQDLPTAAQVSSSAEANGDPLLTKEVDDGLQQLLVEWPIFKKSGLFGTGSKGREHPLFKKIAELQIPLLLAGRFEGATQEIKQSITDYMNGWRYEQGIIYEQGGEFRALLTPCYTTRP
jgi:hypothetical protein